MAQRYYTGTKLKTLLSGDRTVAKSLERKARACVGYLFDQLMPNQKFRSQNWNYPDGSRITAFVWRDVLGERAVARLYAPQLTQNGAWGTALYIESGFISWDLLYDDIAFPLSVYPQSDLVTYLNSDGTLIEAGPPAIYQYLIGRASIVSSAQCADGAFYYQFPDEKSPVDELAYPPALHEDNTYNSIVYSSGLPKDISDRESYNVGVWTGEGRKLYQALLGAGRDWRDILPEGVNPNAATMGAWRSPDGGVWVYVISTAGCWTYQLATPLLLHCIGEDEISLAGDMDRNLYDVFLLGHSRITQDSPVYPLLSAEQMESVYGSDISSVPLAHGWHGLFQPDYTSDPAGCVITVVRNSEETNTYFSRSASVSVTWSGGVPSAILTVTDETEWGGGSARVRVPENDTSAVLLPPGEMIYGSEATVYSFTTPKGVADVICMSKELGGSQDFGTMDAPTITGTGYAESDGGSMTRSGTCGWRVVGGASATAEINPITTSSYTKQGISVTATSTDTLSSADLTSAGEFVSQVILPTAQEYARFYGADPPLVITTQRATWEATLVEHVGLFGMGGSTLCLLYSDTGVVITKAQFWTAGSVRSGTTDPSYAPSVIYGCRTSNNFGASHDFLSVPYGNNVVTVDGPAYLLDGVTYRTYSSSYVPPNGYTTLSDPVNEIEITLVASSGDVVALDDDWGSIGGLSERANIPSAHASWGGELIYSKGYGKQVGPSFIPEAAIEKANLRYIGNI